jgi:hypothetical protein
MTDLRSCAKAGIGFAMLAGLTASVALGEGSEVPDGSVVIGALPFADTGDTTDNYDDFDAVCPFTGSTSPDVFYAFTPAADTTICITLCESGYDTKTYILEDGSFAVVACNDDACSSSGGGGFRSLLTFVPLTGGTTYHIAVDGWLGDRGAYDLIVEDCAPQELECPPGADLEGETCVDGAPDLFNGGCNSTPAVFSSVACGDVVCGDGYFDGATRDTDWYELGLTAGITEVTMSFETQFDGVFGYIETIDITQSPTCGTIVGAINPFGLTTPGGGPVSVSVCLPGGVTSWWFAGPQFTAIIACSGANDYVASWGCESPCPAPPCCTLGDSDEDGDVDFNDLVTLLANWGACPF